MSGQLAFGDLGHVNKPATRAGPAARLTDRDRDLLGLLVIARFLTADQVHRLAFPGKHASVAYRRLLKLSREDGQPAFVRRRAFRTYDGDRVAVWAATAHGLPAALARSPGLPELPKHDVGAQFLEHLIQLNELLLALWQNGARCPRAAHPSFLWIPSDRVRLVWGEWEMREGRRQQRVIQPDAVLELPLQRRRLFLECETGTHQISPGEANAPGATVSKAARYQTFLGDPAADGRRTHYLTQYPDGFAPEVVFLVLTAGRATSVNEALAAWRETLQGKRPAAMRAVTFEEANAGLRKVTGLPTANANARSPRRETSRSLVLGPGDVATIRSFVSEALKSIERARHVFDTDQRTDLPEYPASLAAMRSILERLERAV
ncbi:MAG TPA: replication-relaxation family protein [Anaeromyxobacteraceae bacterium]|nr:replication-relaxation family protein [Anaeromyxobacteraceae bacterium]